MDPDHEWFVKKLWTEDYDNLGHIGEGGFGDVFKVRRKDSPNGDERAVKEIMKSKLTSEADRKALLSECDIMMMVGIHENICALYEVYVTPDRYAMAMELCTGGDLFDKICEDNFRYDVTSICQVVENCCKALAFMHAKGIGHRDIKPENIMLISGNPIVAKLVDFGFAKKTTQLEEAGGGNESLMQTTCGTPQYVAPEVLKCGTKPGTHYGVECDVWSMGVVLYTMLCGYNPMEHDNVQALFRLIMAGKYDRESEEYRVIAPEGKDLIARMLTVNPSERITAKEVLSHPYITANITRTTDDTSALALVLGTVQAKLNTLNNKRFKSAVRGVMLEHRLANHVAKAPEPEAA